MTFEYSYDYSIDTSWNKQVKESPGEKMKEYKNSLTITYKIDPDSDRKIELFRRRWVIPLVGTIDMSLNMTHEKRIENKDAKKYDETLDLSMKPKIRYDITKNIKGEVYYEGKMSEADNGQKINRNNFSLSVRINF